MPGRGSSFSTGFAETPSVARNDDLMDENAWRYKHDVFERTCT